MIDIVKYNIEKARENKKVRNQKGLIKICVDPICGDVYHNVNYMQKYCLNCGGRMIKINEKTYFKKFSYSPHQFDYQTGEPYYPLSHIETQGDMFQKFL
ncbi:MAG: hypothetical protein QM478_11540 [Flavobacteriaceae bacterium]